MDGISSGPAGQRVLLVEEHPATVAALRMVFQRNGCRVRTAQSAADAVVMWSLEPFDCVVINREIGQGRALSEHFLTRVGMRRQDVYAYTVRRSGCG